MVSSTRALKAALIALCGALAGVSGAQTVSSPEPRIVEGVEPAPVSSEAVTGWAVVRFSVLEDGSTSAIRVVEAAPAGIDEGPIVEALSQWVYAPATIDATPVDWHNLETVIVLGDTDRHDPSESFLEGYAAIGRLLEDGAYAEALEAGRDLLDDSVSHSEIGLALAQQSLAHIGRQDWHSALGPLRLATDPRMRSLPVADLLAALQLRFQVEVELGRRQDALATYRRIDYALDDDSPNAYRQIADLLTQEWETVETLQVSARIDDKPWRIPAVRRTFAIDGIEGRIGSIGVECDRRAISLEYAPNAEWSLPESWGHCELFVSGDPGTTFAYYEFQDPQAPEG